MPWFKYQEIDTNMKSLCDACFDLREQFFSSLNLYNYIRKVPSILDLVYSQKRLKLRDIQLNQAGYIYIVYKKFALYTTCHSTLCSLLLPQTLTCRRCWLLLVCLSCGTEVGGPGSPLLSVCPNPPFPGCSSHAIPGHCPIIFSLCYVSYPAHCNKKFKHSTSLGGDYQCVFLNPTGLDVPARPLHVSGVLEMSSREPKDRECSAEARLRGGGKGEISVSLVSWARVSFRRRRFRLLVGVVRERRDTAFFIAGLSL